MLQREDLAKDGSGEIMEREVPGGLALGTTPLRYELLDNLSETGVSTVEPRPEWLATISAGYKKKVTSKDGKTFEIPVVERDGIIHIQDGDELKAPGLARALEEGGGKKLTIAFTADPIIRSDGFVDVSPLIVQRLVKYSRTSLEVFGDATKLTEVKTRKTGTDTAEAIFSTHYVGSKEYAALVKTCKPETSVLFVLVRGVSEDRPRMYWPDTFGCYRIRFTGRNSGRSIVGKIIETLPFTGGHVLGIPFELTLGTRNVAGNDPKLGWARHDIPIWQIGMALPPGADMDPRLFRKVVDRSISEGQILRSLPAPTYTVEHALLEAPRVVDDEEAPEEPDVKALEGLMSNDPPCDPATYRGSWHSGVKDDALLSTEDGRHAFVKRFTAELWKDQPEKQTESLERFLSIARESEASKLIAKMSEVLGQLSAQRMAKRNQAGTKAAAPPSGPAVAPPPTKPAEPTPPPSDPEPEPPTAGDDAPAPAAEDGAPDPGDMGEPSFTAEEAAAETSLQHPDGLTDEERQTLADMAEFDRKMEEATEGQFREVPADPPAAQDAPEEPTTASEAPAAPSAPPKLATEEQKANLERHARPSQLRNIDWTTFTYDEADMLLESIGAPRAARGAKK